jgi:hypothetical protein
VHHSEAMGQALLGARNQPVGLDLFSKFSDLVQISANFKKLHRIHLPQKIMKQNLFGTS